MTKALLYERELLKRFCACLLKSSKFAIGMALLNTGGLEAIGNAVKVCLNRGGSGRILIGIDLPTPPEAIEMLCEWKAKFKSLELRVFQPTSAYFHPKLAIFTTPAGACKAIVGSANLTNGGFKANYEASLYVDDRKVIADLLSFFDENFKGGNVRKIDEEWLKKYRAIFAERRKLIQAAARWREKVRLLKAKSPQSKPIPRGVRGHKFAFTGKITDFPREAELYPFVRKLGGEIADRPGSMGKADCLVHGDILGGRKSTLKLDAAIKKDIPIISVDEFFAIAKRDPRKAP